jgi:hypothetical protein
MPSAEINGFSATGIAEGVGEGDSAVAVAVTVGEAAVSAFGDAAVGEPGDLLQPTNKIKVGTRIGLVFRKKRIKCKSTTETTGAV